jgi:pyruvate formate lyase activating enzyme
VETSGHCPPDIFREVLLNTDYVLMDIKHADPVKHKKYTGVDNSIILHNLGQLKESGKPFVIRIPVIPGINDDEDGMEAAARLIKGGSGLEKVELLPYHKTAGAKYGMVGLVYSPRFATAAQPHIYTGIFDKDGIWCSSL